MKDNSKFGSSDSLIAAVRSIMEKEHTVPKGDKEKKLAALAHPKDKITHKDVLVGRGVLKKENSGERMGTIVATRKEKVEVDPKLKEEEQVDEGSKPADVHSDDKGNRYELHMNAPIAGDRHVIIQTHKNNKKIGTQNPLITHISSKKDNIKNAFSKLKLKGKTTTNEEVEQVDELDKSTVKSYTDKANKQMKTIGKKMLSNPVYPGLDDKEKNTLRKRMAGFDMTFRKGVRASQKTTKEEVENVDERKLTGAEAEKKEKYVLSMKKKMGGFKKRYGERAKEVMYATATKMAKEETVPVQEISTGLASRYLKKTDPETSSPKEVEKRKTGRALALTKKWGGKVGGTAAPKVPTKD